MSNQAIAAAAADKPTGVRWKIFFLLLFLVSVNYIDRASLSVAMPLISKEFDIDPAWQGLILSSFFWTYAFMQVPGGMLADRFKPRIVVALATVFWGAFQAIAAVSTSWFVLLLTRLGLGASEAPIYPAGGKLNGIWMTQTERGRGATLLDGGAPLGAALGSIVIAWLIAAFNSWRMAFVVAGVGTILCGIWAWYYIRNSPREHPSVNEAEARYIEQAHAEEDAGSTPSSGGSWTSYFTFRSVWCMCLGWFFFNVTFYGLLTWMPTYLFKVHNLDIKTLGNTSFIIFFAGFVGELIGGWIGDRWRGSGGSPNLVYPDAVRDCGHHGDHLDLSRRLYEGRGAGRGAAFDDVVLSALVRHVLGHSDGAGGTGKSRVSRRLHESRRQYRGHHNPDHRRFHRASDRVLLPGADVFRARRGRAVDLLDPDRLQPSPAGIGRAGLKDTT